MFQAKSTFTILDDVLYLDLGEEMEEPAKSQLTHCIRALKPATDCTAEDFGVGTTTAALIAIAVNMAIESADPAIIADVCAGTRRCPAPRRRSAPSVGPHDADAKVWGQIIPLDHCTFASTRQTKANVALDRSSEGAATSVRSRAIAAPVDALPKPERIGFCSHVEPRHWSNTPANDLWDPPATQAQHVCQQAAAIVLAFVLAALLGQLGLWAKSL